MAQGGFGIEGKMGNYLSAVIASPFSALGCLFAFFAAAQILSELTNCTDAPLAKTKATKPRLKDNGVELVECSC